MSVHLTSLYLSAKNHIILSVVLKYSDPKDDALLDYEQYQVHITSKYLKFNEHDLKPGRI